MAKQTTHVAVVRQWCISLGVLSAIKVSRQEAEMRLAAYVPMLMDRFPDGAFTTASLEHCARHAVQGFPTYGELAAWLADWWRDHRPQPKALPPPPPIRQRDEPTDEEKAHVSRIVADLVAELRSVEQTKEPRNPRAIHLSPGVLDQINPLPNGHKRVEPLFK